MSAIMHLSYREGKPNTMRSVIITGTSTGIGQATAVVLASRGWRVFATMRNLEKRSLLEQALKEARVQNGIEIEQLKECEGILVTLHDDGSIGVDELRLDGDPSAG